MSNTSMLVANLTIRRKDSDPDDPPIVDTGAHGLRLKTNGIYTLQGPNGAGKSSLIRALMGVPQDRSSAPVDFQLNGERCSVNDVADAIKLGIVAVFQDDQLIPTMTIREQLLLRHGGGGFRTLLLNWVKMLSKRISVTLQLDVSVLKWLPPSDEEKVLSRADDLLRFFDEFHPEANYKSILGKFPRELSGGQHAVARIVLSQLTAGMKVLFLDEVFRGVQREVWPRILDGIRKWAKSSGVCVLAVSHNDEELVRWRPDGRLEMSNRTLSVLPPMNYDVLFAGLPARNSICPVFEIGQHPTWSDELKLAGPWLIFVDEMVHKSEAYSDVTGSLRGHVLMESIVKGGEQIKSLDNAIEMLRKMTALQSSPQSLRTCSVLIVGGGALLNWVGFLSSIIHRGLPTVLVPTTVLSIADVAVGSKTSINLVDPSVGRSFKHALGTYHNPTAVLLDARFIESLDGTERRLGLSECLKHGLLQDKELWRDALALLRQTEPDARACFEVARRTMALKAHVLSLDPWEQSFGRVLLFGHLHAHSLERLTNLAVPHGRAVLFGLLVDLKLSGAQQTYGLLLDACRSSRTLQQAELTAAVGRPEADWRLAYFDDPKDQHLRGSKIQFLRVEGIGDYVEPNTLCESDNLGKLSWSEFWPRLQTVLREL